ELPESVRLPTGVSASPTVKLIGPAAVPDVVVWSVMFEIVGGVLAAPTVRRKPVLALREPSLTVTVTVAVPVWPAAGVSVTVRLAPLPPKAMFAPGSSVWFDELPETVRLPAGVSASPTVKAIGPTGVPVVVDWFAIAEIVGALCAVTVDWNPVLVLSRPSLTVTVTDAVPDWPATGVRVAVRLAPLPPKTMFASGSSAWFDEPPLTVRLATGVSTSPTVKLSGPTAVPGPVVWLAIAVIV